MIKGLIILVFSSFIAFNNSTSTLQGTYSYKYGKDNTGPSGLLEIHYKSPKTILFYLEINRGAPSYNSGALYGELIYNKKSGHYEYIPKDTIEDCKLEFVKVKNRITIKTLAGNCPFGGGVYADGNYLLTNAKNPEYVITRTGKKVFFEKTPPNKFQED